MARRLLWWWMVLCAALCCAVAPARAAALPGRPLALCIARVEPGDTARAMFVSGNRFDCRVNQTAYGPGDFWVIASAPAGVVAGKHWEVRFASMWQRHAALWARFADRSEQHIDLNGIALSRHLRPGAIVQVELPFRPAPLTAILWRVDGSPNLRGVVTGASLATQGQAFTADLTMTAIYAAFAALCLTLLIYNLALLLAMRHWFQIAYCVMVAALLGYAMSSSGVLAWLLPGLANNDRLRINYVLLALSASAALVFARHFFGPSVFSGWLARAVPVIVAGQLGTAVAYVVFAPVGIRVIDRLYVASFLPLLAIIGPVLWRAWRVRSEVRWLFALAWGAPVMMGAARTASALGIVPWSLWLDQSTIISMSLEALLSSLVVAYRIRQIGRDRDLAREGEVQAMLLADTDPLTGLLNRRAFLRHAIGRAGEQSLILADIDHFKAVNEAIGHDGGDEVLRVIARALRAAVPQGALIARIGGEEFAVLGTPPLDAEALLDRVRAERMPFDRRVTISVGTCTGPLDNEADWTALYRRADEALFAAKAAGRDRALASTALSRAA